MKSCSKNVPKYVLENRKVRDSRQFRRIKRAEVLGVIKRLNALMLGLAHTPDHGQFYVARNAMLKLAEAMREKNWHAPQPPYNPSQP